MLDSIGFIDFFPNRWMYIVYFVYILITMSRHSYIEFPQKVPPNFLRNILSIFHEIKEPTHREKLLTSLPRFLGFLRLVVKLKR